MRNTNQDDTPSSSAAQPQQSVYMNLDLPEERQEIIRACEYIVATRRHDPMEAIKLANKLCWKHNNVALVHFTQGQVIRYYCLHLHHTDQNKEKLLKDAINSLKHASKMQPESPEFSYELAHAYFQLAKLKQEGFDLVVQECERGLGLSVFSKMSTMDDLLRNHYLGLKQGLQNLITVAVTKRKVERTQKFVKYYGEYWRRLSFDEKCRFLDVKINHVINFYLSPEFKNVQASEILRKAVDLYAKKSDWFTWSCCFCNEDRKMEDYDVWSSIEKHIDEHFDDDPEPKVKRIRACKCGCYDRVDIKDGMFILHTILVEQSITEDAYDDPIANNNFLRDWLMKEPDVKLELDLWKKRRDRNSQSENQMIFDRIVKLKQDMKAILEKHEKEKQEIADDKHKCFSDKMGAWKEKIMALKLDAVCNSVYDYREILLPILKYIIQVDLECEARKQARKEAKKIKQEEVASEAVENQPENEAEGNTEQ